MADYQAPLKDMNFVLNELVNIKALATIPGYEEALPELVSSILDQASKLAGEVVSPLNASGDLHGVKIDNNNEVQTPEGFKDAYQQFADGGWGSLQFEPDYGGQGLPFTLAIPVQEMWHSANMAWGLCPLLTQGAVEAIQANASDELKSRYLPQMIAGRWSGTMNLTEPQAGSDMATLRTRAERDGDHYRITGQKIFITWGEHDMVDNIVHLVLARLQGAPPGVKGISLFIVPKFLVNDDGSLGQRNDCQVTSLEHKIGIHASPTCVMSYGDNGGAIGYLVGEENKGLVCMFSMMNNARLTVGLQGVAIAERSYQLARDYAKERPQGIAPGGSELGMIIKHPDVRRMLMTMRALTEASRALTYVACASTDYQEKHPDADVSKHHKARAALLTPVVKGWSTEVGLEVTSIGVQVHGGMGFIEETGAGQYYRDARILPIYEGTNGIQALDLVARKTLFDQGAAMDSLLQEMRALVADVAQGTNTLQDESKAFALGVEALADAKALLLKEAKADINWSGAVSFNYLMLMGSVCGAWQMLMAAQVAEAKLTLADNDSSFYSAKLATARFYLDQILPRYLSHAALVKNGSQSIMAMDEDLF
ncbi:MAG: acyl-CoA dehydrogenase C-terminal domain-containing protein [Colwellia sp.]|nr:acyl-CoA dehydrogenase C-terminal domain-containing protein [Colwellia sp.]